MFPVGGSIGEKPIREGLVWECSVGVLHFLAPSLSMDKRSTSAAVPGIGAV